MRVSNLADFLNGWFIGDFSPSVQRTKDFEICLKAFKAGDSEPAAIQLRATEITVVVDGLVNINGQIFGPNSVVVIDPGERAELEVLEDAKLLGVKFPSIPRDKVLVN